MVRSATALRLASCGHMALDSWRHESGRWEGLGS